MVSTKKPSIDEVLAYGKPLLKMFIAERAGDCPPEHQREIEQEGYLRLIEAYPDLEKDAGWKSYVYTHCRGTVLDYLKAGVGFQECRWTIAKEEDADSRFTTKINHRLSLVDATGDDVSIEQVLGVNGIFDEVDLDDIEIRWELVARMASIDDGIHAFAKHILGQTIEQIAPTFGLKRARVGNMIEDFKNRFDNPAYADPWFLQTCYAFGICEYLGLPDVDQSEVVGYSVGWTLTPVDLSKEDKPAENPQMSLLVEIEDRG